VVVVDPAPRGLWLWGVIGLWETKAVYCGTQALHSPPLHVRVPSSHIGPLAEGTVVPQAAVSPGVPQGQSVFGVLQAVELGGVGGGLVVSTGAGVLPLQAWRMKVTAPAMMPTPPSPAADQRMRLALF
jgi:hypothetical protein